MINELLKSNNIKKTSQRILVLNEINDLSEDATLKNIISKCDIDQSTIHRIVDFFLKKGIIERQINCKDEVYYFIHEKHAHYIHCVICHKSEKLKECPMDVDKLNINGYKVIDHTIHINGICKNCQRKEKI